MGFQSPSHRVRHCNGDRWNIVGIENRPFQSPSHRVRHCNHGLALVKVAHVPVSVPFSSGQALQPQVAQNRKALIHKDLSPHGNQSKQTIFPKMAILHPPPSIFGKHLYTYKIRHKFPITFQPLPADTSDK